MHIEMSYTFCEYLCGLLLRDTFNLLEDPSRSVGNRLDGIVAAIND